MRNKYTYPDRLAAERAAHDAQGEALLLGQLLRDVLTGEAEEKRVREKSIDGDRMEILLVTRTSQYGDVSGFVFHRFGNDTYSWMEAESFIRMCDENVRRLDRDYSAWGVFGAAVRETLRPSLVTA